ncbi:hypothetical protein dsat_1001 [Alkalidesulfovibrio alkalitolerans DSM 16529]|jgi:hypothetical protein|uniref:Uncharacterized protein n=1 Tax=Alkalidesulfovibrio alkalitolerans DSM 16529 TaxID=1121439 RepID=S7T2W2_9BACT|nr:hypothetical protein [Alkalidesulfovibrio alkalitolerans]EPR31412.1 hypothetical protein dsat_1001 [Alkalidesulfovibrio alkalitolerans DSM 16529]
MTYAERFCPHCGDKLCEWEAPPETWWGIILVCNNNDCSYFKGSNDEIAGKRDDSGLGTRYAEDPKLDYAPFNLLSWCPRLD